MLNRGSEWRRWEPHIHAPGTVMNNQFSGLNAWADYLSALEQATPVIEAIAVADYYVTDTYVEVLRHKAAGRLPSIKLVFPNVELRLDVATAGGGFVNLHLFVSPEDPQHLDEKPTLFGSLPVTPDVSVAIQRRTPGLWPCSASSRKRALICAKRPGGMKP